MAHDLLTYIKDLKKRDYGEYRSLPFWSWNGSLEKEELLRQTEWMAKQGFGGFFMHARGGLTTEYLGKEWFECIGACVKKAEELGMRGWAYDENGWPSGFAGGKLLKDPGNCDHFLTYSCGEFDGAAFVSYRAEGEGLVRSYEPGEGEYLNIYDHVSVSSADVLNERTVKKFIDITHEEYKKSLSSETFEKLGGFFTDEPQYYRWAHPYTPELVRYFRENYGEDLFAGLGLMFTEKEGYRAFRYKYWKAMQSLMLESFSKQVYKWCENNGVKLTGHYIEETSLEFQMLCCAGIMPFYEYESIPGVDKLGRSVENPISAKQVSSVACQLGKNKVLTESFACCGWDTTPLELKKITDSQFVNGVNILCEHLVPYSEQGQRKREYPPHFGEINPWVNADFAGFNNYVKHAGYFIGESKEIVSVALFCPVRSMYFDYKRENFEKTVYPPDVTYRELAEELSARRIPYHILDETILARHGSAENGRLNVGACSYDTVIFPAVYTMDKSTKTLLDEFYAGGGKMLFTAGLPEYLEGEPYKYDYQSNVTFEDTEAAQPFRVSGGENVRVTLREMDGHRFFFAVNLGDTAQTVQFTGEGLSGFYAVDPETLDYKKVSSAVDLYAGESVLLFSAEGNKEYEPKPKEFALKGGFDVVERSDNFFTLDTLSYSIDGVNYSRPENYGHAFNELLEMHYKGGLYIKYAFNVRRLPEKISLLAEDMNTEYCEINGQRLKLERLTGKDKDLYSAFIAPYLKKGENEIVFKINFFEKDEVYYALFGENVTEGLVNCLVYDTMLEACFLKGDFGVYSEKGFTPGREKNVLMSEGGFYIDKPSSRIEKDAVSEGYPFFAGTVTLEKKFTDKEAAGAILDLSGRVHLAEVYINGHRAEKSYFIHKADISKFIVPGINTVRVKIFTGNRNLLGPHHFKDMEEPMHIGPPAFDFIGTFKNGESPVERKNYSFVRFGLF